jgi:hypothetical protein
MRFVPQRSLLSYCNLQARGVSMVELVFNVIAGFFELIGTIFVEGLKESARKQGRSEIEIKKMEKNVFWSLLAAFIIFFVLAYF